MTERSIDLGLALGGGGARAAYQVGVLRAIARRIPGFHAPIQTGISAGAINIAHLANHPGPFEDTVADLTALWQHLDVGSVFEVSGFDLLGRMLRVGLRLTIGWPPAVRRVHGMVDTAPLRRTLMEALGTEDGSLGGVRRNLEDGRLKAVALITTRYSTNQTVTFYSGRDIAGWERPKRRTVATALSVDHVMASAALPLFFPPIEIDGAWYGDGGIRLVAPLAPALHLGADRILAIDTRYRVGGAEADVPRFDGAPSPAQVLGVLFNAVFLDQLDQDALALDRINRLLAEIPPDQRGDLREVGLFVVRPSRDLGALANDFEPELPRVFRSLTRRWGTKQAKHQDLLSTVMFQPDYIRLLLELGEEDGDAHVDRLVEFLDP